MCAAGQASVLGFGQIAAAAALAVFALFWFTLPGRVRLE